jgi:hypothetical protein
MCHGSATIVSERNLHKHNNHFVIFVLLQPPLGQGDAMCLNMETENRATPKKKKKKKRKKKANSISRKMSKESNENVC